MPLPDEYPFLLPDDELAAETNELFETFREVYSVDFKKLLPELQLAIVQAGIQEQSRRDHFPSL